MTRRTLFIGAVLALIISNLGASVSTPNHAAAVTAMSAATAAATTATDPIVNFNTQTHKYHCPTCRYAKQCTKNCVEIKRSEAIAKGGVACKICGGTCK